MIIKIINYSNDAESVLEPYREIIEKYKAIKCADTKNKLHSLEQGEPYIKRIK